MMKLISSFIAFIPDMLLIIGIVLTIFAVALGIYLLKGIDAILGGIAWLIEKPYRLIIAALLILCAAGWWTAHQNDQRADQWQRASADEATAHLQTIADTKAAAISAQLIAEQNRAAVEARWQAQYQDAADELQNLRHRNAGLVSDWLQQSGQAHHAPDPRSASSADLPSPAQMPDRSLRDADTAIIPVADLYLSAEAFAQLEALIGWLNAAQSVETSPAEPIT